MEAEMKHKVSLEKAKKDNPYGVPVCPVAGRRAKPKKKL